MKTIGKLFALVLAILVTTPVADAKKKVEPSRINIELPTYANVSQRYGNLDYGVRINVSSDVRSDAIVNTNDLPSKEAADFPQVYMDYSLIQSAEQYLDSYATGLGLKVGSSANSDFVLRVRISDFRLRVRDYNLKKRVFSSSAAVVISWELYSPENQQVISCCYKLGAV